MDCVFYTNYELQVDALLDGPHRHRVELAAGVGRCAAPHGRHVPRHRHARHRPRRRHAHDRARGRRRDDSRTTCAARRSPSGRRTRRRPRCCRFTACAGQGLQPGDDLRVLRHDVLVGKHGDHVGGERDALRRAHRRRSAAAACVLDLNWELWRRDGTVDPRDRARARHDRRPSTTATSRSRRASSEARRPRGREALFAMGYDEPGAPRDDGPRGAQGVAARAHARLRRPHGGDGAVGFFAGGT